MFDTQSTFWLFLAAVFAAEGRTVDSTACLLFASLQLCNESYTLLDNYSEARRIMQSFSSDQDSASSSSSGSESDLSSHYSSSDTEAEKPRKRRKYTY